VNHGEEAQSEVRGRRVRIVGAAAFSVIALLMCGMLARVVQLQMAPGEQLVANMDPRVTHVKEPGVRGDLLDRRGRALAITRFGYRVFVDPLRFPSPPGPAMQRLSDAVGMPVEVLARRLIPAIDHNDKLESDPDAEREEHGQVKRLEKYLSIGSVLDDTRVAMVREAAIPGVHLELRSVREAPGNEFAAPLIGFVGIDHDGLAGAEKLIDKKVRPTGGEITYVRDSKSRPLFVAPGGYVPPERGADVRLSLDLEMQRTATEELTRGVEEADAAGGRCVVMDPETGEVLAMVDIIRHLRGASEFPWVDKGDRTPFSKNGRRFRTIRDDKEREAHPSLGRNRCVEDVYEPGSTFKPFMWSTVTQLGLADPAEIINTEGGHWTPYGNRHLEDVVKRDQMTWAEVLINSSNIGMAKVTGRMTSQQMRDAVLKFGFGSKTGIGLPGESAGIVTSMKDWSKYSQVSVAMGHEIAVTPVQMVRGFSAFARDGERIGTLPEARFTAADPDLGASEGKRVLPPDIAELTRRTMRGVTQKVDNKLAERDPSAGPPKYEWFGKSGTAEIPLGKAPKGKRRPVGCDGYFRGQYNSSFIAGAPFEHPRLVVLVVIDDPGPGTIAKKQHYGSYVAGPVVRRVLERGLTYLGVPASPPLEKGSEVASAGGTRE
jgi:cell division protein FtsI/penicillin-binding protein 2